MSPTGPAVSDATLGAWLVKAGPGAPAVVEGARTGFTSIASRCVRPTYRADLVRAGQPVLLWISGRDPRLPAGIHAAGTATGPVLHGADSEPAMPVRLRAVDPVVTREEILAVPGLAGLEVLRMPAGSNPSYVDREQLGLLTHLFPQLLVDDSRVEPRRAQDLG